MFRAAIWCSRGALAYLDLSKPRIGSLVLVVVAVSALVAGSEPIENWRWLNLLAGTAHRGGQRQHVQPTDRTPAAMR